MSFFSLFKKNIKNKENYSLVFNISSGRVAGAIVKFTERAGVSVQAYSQENILMNQETALASAIDTLAKKLQKNNLTKINRVFYLFSSPWSISQTKTIRIKEFKPFKVTHEYLDRLVSEQEEKFQTEIAVHGRIIEKKIIQVKINGYTVNQIENKLANDLELSVFSTVVPEKVLNLIETAVAKTFVVKQSWYHSSALAVFSVVRDLFPQQEDFIQLDLTEELTDLAIIKDGLIMSLASIPLGRNHFIRALSTELKVTPEIADSMIKLNYSGKNDELASLKLGVAMDRAVKSWLDQLTVIFNSLKEKIYISQVIYFVANNDLTDFFIGKLKKMDFQVKAIDQRRVNLLNGEDDVSLKIGLIFLDKVYKI